ncbi:MAG: WD40 repeat domain-containing protein [Verrucomicrobiota bacterium]
MPPLTTSPLRAADWVSRLDDAPAGLAWASDGGRLVWLGVGGRAWLLDAATGATQRGFAAHDDGAFQVAWQPDGACFATSGQDGRVRLWHPDREEADHAVKVGPGWVEHLAWSPDGKRLAAAVGREVVLLDAGGAILHRLGPRRNTVSGLCWRKDGSQLAVSAYAGVELYDAGSGRVTASLPWKTSLISVSWSPTGRWVVAGTQEKTVQVWELPFRPGEELAMSGYAFKVRELGWHYSGRYLATGGGEELMVWDCGGKGPDGTEPRLLRGHVGRVTSLAYQRRGHLLASGGQDGSIFFWNAGRFLTPLQQVHLGSGVGHLTWNPGETRVAAAGEDGSVAVAGAPVT